jgi:hypothetical protein
MATHGRSMRLVAVLLVLIAFASALNIRHGGAETMSVVVASDSAVPDFPDVINFDLKATTEHEIKRIELRYSLGGENKIYLTTPEFTSSSDVDLSFPLDMRTKGIPPGVTITYRWRFVGADGAYFETEPVEFVWNDDRFSWTSATSDQVTLHAYNGDESFNNEILDSAQQAIDKLESEFDLEPIKPIDIWVYDSNNDFEGARLTNSETWSAAVTFPELDLVLAVIPDGRHSEIGRIVPHEMSHQVLHQATENPFNHPPTWLDEGLAVLNQDNGNENADEIVRAAAQEDRLLSIRSLNSSFPYDPNEVDLAYAESLSIVNFIIDHFGADKMSALIAAYREGLSHDEATKQALGVDLDELDQIWKASLA